MNAIRASVTMKRGRKVKKKLANLHTLAHLQLILIGKILQDALETDVLLRCFSQELVSHMHKSVFDRCRDLARMWSWNFGDRIGLPNSEESLDFSQVVSSLASDNTPVVGRSCKHASFGKWS